MSAKLWDTSKDGSIEYRSLTNDQLEGGMNVMRNSFFIDEKVCIGVELSKHPGAATELEELCLRAARDGVSLIAIEKDTGKVVGVSFNKLQVKTDGQEAYFKQYAENCKYASSKALVQFMNDADAVVDIFELSNAKCLLELMFLAVLPDYRNRGIGRRLCELTFQLGRELMSGKNVKTSLDDKPLPLEPVPTVASAIFTATISQELGRKLGFVRAVEISYEKFMFEGKSFASRIGPDTPNTTVEYKLL
ncbi:hypothetical protein ILUMI_10783 [Ignelater luminosus]|uniref:N-acetyltransferase domain-containing protein n=1 Tax=Ignelater luminosus TaxID=2038154 RepID=A0A8K0CX75_IGNLU|nr:hypothetical protein ILUMI_10783 [Ignelater luminosus]